MISSWRTFGSGSTLPLCGKGADGYPWLRGDIVRDQSDCGCGGAFAGVEAASDMIRITSNTTALMPRMCASVPAQLMR